MRLRMQVLESVSHGMSCRSTQSLLQRHAHDGWVSAVRDPRDDRPWPCVTTEPSSLPQHHEMNLVQPEPAPAPHEESRVRCASGPLVSAVPPAVPATYGTTCGTTAACGRTSCRVSFCAAAPTRPPLHRRTFPCDAVYQAALPAWHRHERA